MKVIAGVHGTTVCSPGCESELKRFCCLFAEEAVGSFSRMLIAMKEICSYLQMLVFVKLVREMLLFRVSVFTARC